MVALFILGIFTYHRTSAQNYYSNFPTPASTDYQSSKPSGVACVLPDFSGVQNVADADLSNAATVNGTVGVSLVCNSVNQYSIRAKLYFPNAATFAPTGYYAGFKVRLNTLLSLTTLQNNISLRTYLAGALKETQPGTALVGLNLLSTSTAAADVYFQTTMPFDEVEIVIGTSVLSLNTAFSYEFFYSYASPAVILPLKLSSFSARAEAGNVNLSWTATNEKNMANYVVERSDEAGHSFSYVGSVDAKNSEAKTIYEYRDGNIKTGKYLYRLKMVDKDGTVTYSATTGVVIIGKTFWSIYPTMLSSNEQVLVTLSTTSSANKYLVQITGLDGKVISSSVASNGRITLSTQTWAKGMYLVRLFENQQIIATKKIIVQ